MRDLMLEELEAGKRIISAGSEIIPTWTVFTPEGAYAIMTRFNPDQPEQLGKLLDLVPKFLAWKSATSFLLLTETWLGLEGERAEEAVLVVAVSRAEQIGVISRIHRNPELRFDPPEWVLEEHLDPTYFRLLPRGESVVAAEEAAELALMFGEAGELPAKRVH